MIQATDEVSVQAKICRRNLNITHIFFLITQSDSKRLCTYLWPDNGDMRPSFRFLGYVHIALHLFYPLLLKSEHFSYGRILICQT